MSQALVQSIHNVYTPEKTFPRREVRPLEERVFQNALDTAERLDHVRSVVVQVPQFAVVSLMRPPERILFQNLTTTTHSALSCRNSASLTGHTYRQKTSNVTEDFTRLRKCSLHENSTYRVGQKKRGHFVLRLLTSEILKRSASNLAPIKVILFLTLIHNLFESTLEKKWRHLVNNNNRNKFVLLLHQISENKIRPQQQNRYTKSTFYMSVEHEFNVSAGCRTTQSLQTTMPFTDALVLSMNDCGSFCHASTMARFSSSIEMKL